MSKFTVAKARNKLKKQDRKIKALILERQTVIGRKKKSRIGWQIDGMVRTKSLIEKLICWGVAKPVTFWDRLFVISIKIKRRISELNPIRGGNI